MSGEHLFLCRGAKVAVRDSCVEVLTDPAVRYCPFVESFYGIKRIDREAVARIVRMKMERFGFCTPNRCFDPRPVVPFGSSEIISACMRKGLLDCAVTVCEGAGTVISDNPDLVQGIGAMLNGILSTSPIPEVVRAISGMGGTVLDSSKAIIDQVRGVKRAISIGFKRIAATVIGPMASSIPRIRELERRYGVQVAIFSTCNTIVAPEDVPCLLGADVVCSSASCAVREVVGPKSLLQLGVSIPVFVLTPLGKELSLAYLGESKVPVVVHRAKMPYIVPSKQPVIHVYKAKGQKAHRNFQGDVAETIRCRNHAPRGGSDSPSLSVAEGSGDPRRSTLPGKARRGNF